MKLLPRFFYIIFLIATISACAFGNRHTYHDTVAELDATGTIAIAVTSHDQRDYVISGNKNPIFVGLQRGGYGNPFDVLTESGDPLAQDMTISVVMSLSKKGFQAIPVASSHLEDQQSLISRMKGTKAVRFLIFTIHEWKSDTYQNTALIYDVDATIMNENEVILGQSKIKGRDNLGGSFMNPPAYAKKAIPNVFREKIEMLLNNEKILNALQ